MSTVVYGIKNCNTIKKVLIWLEAKNQPFSFHDYRKNGINQNMLKKFIKELGWERLVNKQGTIFRALSKEQKNNLNEFNAIALMLIQPTIIKRPVLEHEGHYYLGFKLDEYAVIFGE
ncbi:ArsC family reductase [Candidatus Enterovibrio altilux]|uniref:Glutathione-dependent thiol reductase n=1 Tax=Candidatus Enterovibrio altilux TaxID=1927128 RepID=A0A291B6J0_9GAMM|nr:ArsC family reductase [Candidatus Enterovibrio luxaltus]ATF08615.1 glutathione-dependent thiol reductase [Candidatus Enterovibrio luxaltus]